MWTDSSPSQSHQSNFSGVLSLSERLSLPDAPGVITWIGSDATMTQCAAVNYTNVAYSVFPFEFRTNFLSDLLGLPVADFVIIAISEFPGILGFLIVRSESYSGRLLAYAGDNTNVASCAMRRKPRNRVP